MPLTSSIIQVLIGFVKRVPRSDRAAEVDLTANPTANPTRDTRPTMLPAPEPSPGVGDGQTLWSIDPVIPLSKA